MVFDTFLPLGTMMKRILIFYPLLRHFNMLKYRYRKV